MMRTMGEQPWSAQHALEAAGVAALVAEQFPDLAPVEATYLDEGWDSVVYEANRAWVFRFPKRPEVEACQDVERTLLPALATRLALPIPVPERLGRATSAYPFRFLGYRKLAGTPAILLSLEAVEVAACGTQLGAFLMALHDVPLDEARSLGVRESPDRRCFERWHRHVVTRLPSMSAALSAPLRAATDAFLSSPLPGDFTGPPCLVHCDLGDTHVLVDEAARRVAGILDWGDACLGDPALDFAGLLQWLGEPLLAGSLAAYRGATVDERFLERARAAAVYTSFSALWYGLEGHRPEYVRSGLRSLRHTLLGAAGTARRQIPDLRLDRFEPSLAAVVAGWARTPEEVGAWCARSEAPVPPEVVAGWSREPDVEAFVARLGGEVVGYGELWRDADEGEVELARLIVSPPHRGQGLGAVLARTLAARARADHPELAQVVLRVRSGNTAALRAYARAGFVPVEQAEAAAWNARQPEAFAWMRMPHAARRG